MYKWGDYMKIHTIVARDIPDAWFQCIYDIFDYGNEYIIDKGSFEGQKRLEFDYITIHIKFPGTRPLEPDIPEHFGIPNPVAEGYIEDYLPYLMTDKKAENEDYTYGERLAGYEWYGHIQKGRCRRLRVNQIDHWIDVLKKTPLTNQAVLQVGVPQDSLLGDPPCLRHIDLRVESGKLHFIVYFRSWDLFNGFPANLGAIQLLKEYMASEIGVEDGEIIASSKGLHLYDYVWELAELRTNRKIK